ncbi:hypothetical protein CONLIGDRAFT_650109 [Coniochaeta ligniaria NRRL 30616]|uniref:Uncharacterized protein n=1 Tax=Coniochaeta ligniaria NRRL 30616 TaxID=1408157 RepID=A0A1J7J680_9PEZI|nr:hypothetical protein CONLIGDRAFT_650109 [Coniochaeta ligniaria NRRL 30616]
MLDKRDGLFTAAGACRFTKTGDVAVRWLTARLNSRARLSLQKCGNHSVRVPVSLSPNAGVGSLQASGKRALTATDCLPGLMAGSVGDASGRASRGAEIYPLLSRAGNNVEVINPLTPDERL